MFFVNQFLHGLKEYIRSAIILHQSKNMDTASALTFLQEQEQSRQSVLVKVGSRVFFTNDKSKQRIHKPDKPASDEKWAAIKAYRKANGLFYICGEK